MSKLTIEARPGQVREITTKSGDKFTFVVTSATRAIIEIDPGDAVKRVILDETASAANGVEDKLK